jgi:hypothetical protein
MIFIAVALAVFVVTTAPDERVTTAGERELLLLGIAIGIVLVEAVRLARGR